MFSAADLRWSSHGLCIGQDLNLAQMCFDRVSYFEAWTVNHKKFPQQMWYRKKQGKLFFLYVEFDVIFIST